MTRARAVVLLASLVVAAPATAAAQSSSASVAINAFLDIALTTGSVRDLIFASTPPGTSQSIAAANAAGCSGCQSGMWQLTNLSNSNQAARRFVDITFSALPTTLTRTGGGASLAVSYVAKTCLTNRFGTEYYCDAQWTPAVGVVHGARINPDPAGQNGQRSMSIYLGGSISPPTTQQAGNYNGVITVTFAYGAT